MISYKVIDGDYDNYEDARLVELNTPLVLEGEEKTKIVIAQGSGFASDPKTGIFDPESGDLILEALTEEAALTDLVRISDNLELKVSKSHEI